MCCNFVVLLCRVSESGWIRTDTSFYSSCPPCRTNTRTPISSLAASGRAKTLFAETKRSLAPSVGPRKTGRSRRRSRNEEAQPTSPSRGKCHEKKAARGSNSNAKVRGQRTYVTSHQTCTLIYIVLAVGTAQLLLYVAFGFVDVCRHQQHY